MVFEDDEDEDPDDEDEHGSHKKTKVRRIHLVKLHFDTNVSDNCIGGGESPGCNHPGS
jgi:hypothetical protein